MKALSTTSQPWCPPVCSAGLTGGAVTLILGDVRIATNVRQQGDGARAIGTRVSQAVKEAVLDRGETWIQRAFVVHHWALTAYEPLRDFAGNRIGMLYVGLPEAPFSALRWRVVMALMLTIGAGVLFASWMSWRLARGILTPLERIENAMRAVGNLDRECVR